MASRRPRITDLADIAVPAQPAVSPDGTAVAYVLRTNDLAADRIVRGIWRVGVHSGSAHRLTAGPDDSAPAWSPDGTRLAFLRAGQLWSLPTGGGEPHQLTDLPAGAGAAVWSPDGTRIAFSAPVDPPDGPLVTGRLDYQIDGVDLFPLRRNHIHLLDVDTGRCRRLTEGDWHAAHPVWSPDGTRLAFVAGPTADADLTRYTGAYVLDTTVDTATPTLVGPPAGIAGPMIWTADGAALLVVGATDTAGGHAGLLRIPLAGGKTADGEIVDLAVALDRNVMPGGPAYPGALPQLVDGGATVLFCARDRGCTHLYAVDVAGGAPRKVVGGAGRVVSGLSAAGGSTVVVLSTPASFGEIVAVDPAGGAETVRTEHGATLAGVEFFPRVEREFTISDGTVVAGWLLRDPDASGAGPLLLDIHGGPHNAWHGGADEIHLYHQELAALGWSVLTVNPRASDGYGEAFYLAAVDAWGEGDARDFLEPLDVLVAEGVADPDRLAVAGYSYGGFMTCYLTAHDDRFAAAMAGGVVSDLVSMAGTSDAGHEIGTADLAAPPWRDPARYRELSPYTRVDRVHTPTLVVHGAADLRCPVGQAQQWFTALRERGVPTELVLYPGATHAFILEGRPSERIDYNRRTLDWLDRHAGAPRGPRLDAAHWGRRLDALARRHGVPGAALGILRLVPDRPDEAIEVATGVLNAATGVPATADSLFQIGSITKVWTATVIMRLVDDGALDLDAPVVDVLPEFRLADPDVTKRVTARHLLTHTSGVDGDLFADTGRGDDCVEKYVALLADLPNNHPLGATLSYSNAGFVVLGRIIERLTGQVWDRALRERLIEPLGLARSVTLPEEAILHRAAVGHAAADDGTPTPTAHWVLPRSVGPAGMVTASAADVLAFARLHLAGGVTPDGRRLLSAAGVAAMVDRHADVPDEYVSHRSWGLGWSRYDWNGHSVAGHDGSTIGQDAFLRMLPDAGLAVVLLTNGGSAGDLYADLFGEIFAELAGVEMPARPAPPADPPAVDVSRHAGRYERTGERLDVLVRDGGMVLRATVTGPMAELDPEPPRDQPMVPLDDTGDRFAVREPDGGAWRPVTFYRLPTGEPYVYRYGRATPKTG